MSKAGSPNAGTGAQRLVGAVAIGADTEGRPILIGCRCTSCKAEMVPPVEVCPLCGGEELERSVQPGEGTLYTYTVVHVGAKKWRRPLKIGYVDLTNGVRVFSHLEGDAAIGDTVVFDIAAVGMDHDGIELTNYVFRKRGDTP